MLEFNPGRRAALQIAARPLQLACTVCLATSLVATGAVAVAAAGVDPITGVLRVAPSHGTELVHRGSVASADFGRGTATVESRTIGTNRYVSVVRLRFSHGGLVARGTVRQRLFNSDSFTITGRLAVLRRTGALRRFQRRLTVRGSGRSSLEQMRITLRSGG